ncbi:hypothetical protein B0J14DRAFT_654107 [Halenospora varia]|nr:hypothetical protein B0J14DRAFT_654107 [Halenospora varia]
MHALTLYEVSIVPFIAELKIISKLIVKGFDNVKGDESALLGSRLIEDISNASATQRRDVLSALAKANLSPMAYDEKTFPELQERIAKTIAVLESVDSKSMEGMEDKEVILATRNNEQKFTSLSYVTNLRNPQFLLPHVHGVCTLEEGGRTGRQECLPRTGLELRNAEGVLPGLSDAIGWCLASTRFLKL